MYWYIFVVKCENKFEQLNIKQVYKYLILLKYMIGYNFYLKYFYKIKQPSDTSLEFDL
jgi:hypothetical protein